VDPVAASERDSATAGLCGSLDVSSFGDGPRYVAHELPSVRRDDAKKRGDSQRRHCGPMAQAARET
jgi:hypothetical protein